MDATARTALLASFEQLWRGHSDLRFGQLLREAVGDPAIRDPVVLDEAAVAAGVDRILRDDPGQAPPPGPYWDTETRGDRTFANGLPRDPARIPRLLETLARAWVIHPSLTLGQLVGLALDADGATETNYRSRLLVIEDGTLRRLLARLAS